MAVIRCPACGKPNPDFLDICQYCDAPLHAPAAPESAAPAAGASQPPAPVVGGTEQDIFAQLRSAAPASDDEAEAQPIAEIPDWLSRLGGPEGSAEAAPAEPPGPADESATKVSSWLDSLRSEEPADQADSRDWYWTGTQGEAETPAAKPAASAPNEELPDWLRAVDTSAAGQAAPAADQAAGLPDWLQGVSAGTTAEPHQPAAPSPLAASPAPAEELPDWLQSVGGTPAAPPPPARPAAAPSAFAAGPEEALPDWLQEFPGAAQAEPAPAQGAPGAPSAFAATPAEELPDWLQGFSAAAPAEPAPAQPGAAPSPFAAEPAEEFPDWLEGFSAAAPAEAAPAQGTPVAPSAFAAEPEEALPDWLQGMGGEGAQPPEAVPAQPASASPFGAEPPAAGGGPFAPEAATGDELPEWLRTVGSAAPSGEAAPAIGEVPDWLQSFDQAIPEQPPVAPLAAAAALEATPSPEEDLPEWLRTIGAGTQGAPTMPPAEARPTAWLGTPGALQGGPAIISQDTSAEDQPEWLRGLGTSPAAPETEAPEAPAAASEEQPEWLRSLGVTTPLPGQPAGIPPLEPSAGAEQPEWLRGLDTSATIPAGPAAPAGPVSPFGAGEAAVPEAAAGKLPDWLANLAPGKAGGEPQPSGVAGVHLAPVALPSWLEAMRPVEVQRPTITPEVDDYEETVGVLAGLRGVLRAQPTVTQPGKSAILVHKLEVTEAQAKQANALTRTLAEAAEAHPAAKRSFWAALPVARLAVFAALFVAFVIPLSLPAAKGYFAPVQSSNQSAQDAFTTLDALSPAQPVLVAFDYDPAQAGELDPLAQAIIAHLKRHSVPVVGISTSPTGAATGEALLNQSYDRAAYGTQYVNLGYLPGGPVGTLQLTNGLRALFTVDYRGSDAVWQSAVLAQAQQLSDFGAIVLVSATPDTVRAWVEQLRFYDHKPALIAAVSAGAEPLVRPYYDHDPAKAQINGLVSGILGAAQYERQAGVPGAATNDMWDVLGWGLLAVIVLLIGGNVFYGLAGLLRRQKR